MKRQICFLLICQILFELMVTKAAGLAVHTSPASPQTKPAGSSVVFTCTVSDCGDNCGQLSDLDLYWTTGDGQRLSSSPDSRLTVERFNATSQHLTIRRIHEGDAGTYTCVALAADVTATHTAQLVIYDDKVFEESASSITSETGRDVFLECVAKGTPPPAIVWRRDRAANKEIIPEDTVKYKYENGGLRIFNAIPSDAGRYECCAGVTSQGHFNVKPITLNILYSPVISAAPNNTVALRGSDVILVCRVHGNPPVHISWYREQKASEHIKVKVKMPQGEGSETLRIANVGDGDVAKYHCRAKNSQGEREATADVTLMVPPRITELPHKTTLEFGTMIVVCESTGIPTPTITWQRVGDPFPYVDGFQPDDRRVSVESAMQPGKSKLVLHNITRSYGGLYTCSASNPAGSDSKNATLTVEYRPRVTVGVTEVFAWSGQSVNVTCHGQGVPPPSINWLRSGHFITDNYIYSIVNVRSPDSVTSTLKISIGSDFYESYIYDTYNCLAKNHYGSDSKPIYIRQATEPEMPRNITVVRTWPHGVIIHAEPSKRKPNLNVTSWMVKYSRSDNGRETDEKLSIFPSPENMEIADLMPETTYIFQISAGNEVGYGTASKIRIITPVDTTEKPQKHESRYDDNDDDIKYSGEISVRTFIKKDDLESRKGPTQSPLIDMVTTMGQLRSADGLEIVRQQHSLESSGDSVLGLPLLAVVGLAAGVALIIGLLLGVLCVRRARRAGDKGRRYPRLLDASSQRQQSEALRTAALARDFEHIPMLTVDTPAVHEGSANCDMPRTSSFDTGNKVKTRPQMVLFENPLSPGSSGPSYATMDMQLRQAMQNTSSATSGNIGTMGRCRNAQLPQMTAACAELGSPVYLYGQLPAPPPFLLQHPSTLTSVSAGVGAGVGSEGVIREMASVHNVIDGYHSGDTVDDLDEFDTGDVVAYFEKYPYFANV